MSNNHKTLYDIVDTDIDSELQLVDLESIYPELLNIYNSYLSLPEALENSFNNIMKRIPAAIEEHQISGSLIEEDFSNEDLAFLYGIYLLFC